MIQGKDIVVVSLQPWYYPIGSNCKNIASQLAMHNRVLYVNMPVSRKVFHQKNNEKGVAQHIEIIKSKQPTVVEIEPNFWQFYPTSILESIGSLPIRFIFDFLNKLNNYRFAADIKTAIQHLGFNDIILFNDNDIYNGFRLKEMLKPTLYVYYMRDFLQGYHYWKKHTTVLEPKLITKSDLVVTNSLLYAEYCKKLNPRSFFVGQGCSFEIFDIQKKRSIPEVLQGIPHPIIGYVGFLDAERLSIEIIDHIANERPQYQVVLVGPEDETFAASNLHQVKNVHFIGRRPMQELADFVAAFDVCINPQKVNPITAGNYPLKIDEYLAMGKPVVATQTMAMSMFKDYCFLADSSADYPGLVDEALASNSADNQLYRVAFALSHTWEACLEKIEEALALAPQNASETRR